MTDDEMSIIHTVPHILGYNSYNGYVVRTGKDGFEYVLKYPSYPRAALK